VANAPPLRLPLYFLLNFKPLNTNYVDDDEDETVNLTLNNIV